MIELLNAPGNWTEDFEHENGKYACHCVVCHKPFMGHKRRVVCKVCSEPSSIIGKDSDTLLKAEASHIVIDVIKLSDKEK